MSTEPLKIDVAQSIPVFMDNERTPYGIACILFASRLARDRFNVLNHFSTFNWIDSVDPIPTPIETPIADLMDKRALEFSGKSIALQWSGGVDSTALLLSFIKNGFSKEDLVIFYDKNSIEEYPKLHSWLQEQGYNLQLVKSWQKALASTEADVIINGWCADQLFGSMFFHKAHDKYFYTIEELLASLSFPFGVLTESEIKDFSKVYKDMGKKLFGFDINLASQFGWLTNFCLKWTWVSTYNDLFLLETPAYGKTHCFYNTEYFQAWSLGNFPNIEKFNIYGKDTLYYKKELKEYCNSIFPDPDFLENKTKVPSWNASISTKTQIDYRLVIKTNNGYDIFYVPIVKNGNSNTTLYEALFTKYKK